MWLIDKIKFKRKRRAFVEARVSSYYVHVYKGSRYHLEVLRDKKYSQYSDDRVLEYIDDNISHKSFVSGFFKAQNYAKEFDYYFTWETKQK